MATLNDEVKTFIVQQLACFDTPSGVAKAVKEEFGLEVSRQAVEAYDPGKRAAANLSDGYRQIFEATRTAFLAETATIGISHKAVRLRTLQRLAEKAERQGNMAFVASVLEQAAKECGDAFTNKRQVEATGKDGSPLIDGGITVAFVRAPPVHAG
ncbi:DUF2280 domain-containing protein [Methylobacterium sp. WL30]|uniref:DUF2280 domain-containing protein n=1 Tax=unclassified Methylobacterium TaxID=2615210 RepID=UPI0011C8CC8B|nr:MULTISPECIES: DUF2280 domain-containing protein [unclassified Methylobacterium]TXN38987.1 DUF2280 domain-containing protein [Methylobacterium sp. WL93]TXN52274.1 DUF2280 domain-containing protein [Methylobacterium sp. WL119]TXN70643.1 DUF2280 domain-containing protein [Methylobacterium sp. WL30]